MNREGAAMGIEARGGKLPYAAVITAVASHFHHGVNQVHVHHGRAFLAADSEDEAYGIATRIAERRYPSSEDWKYRDVTLVPLADLDWIGRHDLDKVDAVPSPIPKHAAAGA